MAELRPDICVIGAGSAGLSVAAGAAQLGAETVLVEAGLMGGDCLNFGCVPSKALLAAAKAAVAHRAAAGFGIAYDPPRIDLARVAAHIKEVIASIAPHDSVERFEQLGVTVIKGWAKFVDPRTLAVGDTRIVARRFVLATGSTPFIPPIKGLDQVPYLTNETVFERVAEIRDLIVLGGGPIGVELAQGFARLGAKVQVVEMAHLLPRDDADAVAVVRGALRRDGIVLHEGSAATEVQQANGRMRVAIATKGATHWIEAEHLLVAVGRRPRVDNMGLEAAGIMASPKGIVTDVGLRTSNTRAYAIGDCNGGPAFTHIAGHQAGLVIRSALFRLPITFDTRTIPWVTYTDPELAQIGLTEAAARRQPGLNPTVTRLAMAQNDRARTERQEEGFIKVISDARGRVVGVTMVGAEAGELLAPWALAMVRGLKLSALAGVLLPYPTRGELAKRAAGAFYAAKLFSPAVRRLVRVLRWFG